MNLRHANSPYHAPSPASEPTLTNADINTNNDSNALYPNGATLNGTNITLTNGANLSVTGNTALHGDYTFINTSGSGARRIDFQGNATGTASTYSLASNLTLSGRIAENAR